jgi:hypothetical protein
VLLLKEFAAAGVQTGGFTARRAKCVTREKTKRGML